MSKNVYDGRYGNLYAQVTIEKNTVKRFIKKVKYILKFAFSFGRCLVVDFGKICYKYVLGFDECDVYSQFNSNCAHILYTLVTCNGDYSDMDILRKSESSQTRI